MILPKVRDSRFITIRRGGTLSDKDHYLLAVWAAKCAEHVLHYFEEKYPNDKRPEIAIQSAIAWAKGEMKLNDSKRAAWESNKAAQGKNGPAKYAALSAGQAAVVGHVPAHELGAAAYAIRAVIESSENDLKEENAKRECQWQKDQLPEEIRDLVIDDEKNRNNICWNVF